MKKKQNKQAAGGYSGISPKDVELINMEWKSSTSPQQKGQPGKSDFRLNMQFEVNNNSYHVSTPLLPDSDYETEHAWVFKAIHALVQLINKGKSSILLDADNNFKPVTSSDSTNLRIVASTSLGNIASSLRKIASDL